MSHILAFIAGINTCMAVILLLIGRPDDALKCLLGAAGGVFWAWAISRLGTKKDG